MKRWLLLGALALVIVLALVLVLLLTDQCLQRVAALIQPELAPLGGGRPKCGPCSFLILGGGGPVPTDLDLPFLVQFTTSWSPESRRMTATLSKLAPRLKGKAHVVTLTSQTYAPEGDAATVNPNSPTNMAGGTAVVVPLGSQAYAAQANRWHVGRTPTVILASAKGKEIARREGVMSAKELSSWLGSHGIAPARASVTEPAKRSGRTTGTLTTTRASASASPRMTAKRGRPSIASAIVAATIPASS